MAPFRTLLAAVLGSAVALGSVAATPAAAQAPAAAQDWKKEFDDVCAKTQDAMALPLDELKGLVARCDKLLPRIEKLEESQRKVYAKRLQLCRDLYQFVVESKEKG